MTKKILKRDTEVKNPYPEKGVFPDPRIPMPKWMNAKVYRDKTIVRTYGIDGGDKQVVISRPNPKPDIMKLIEKEMMDSRVLKNPHKYSKLS